MFKLDRVAIPGGADYNTAEEAISNGLRGTFREFTLSLVEGEDRALLWVRWDTDPERESLYSITCDTVEEVAELKSRIALRNRQIRDLRRSLRR